MLKVFRWMVKLLNKSILEKVDELIELIENSPDYQKYLYLKKQMEKDSELTSLINEVKVLQKDVVHHLDKKNILKEKMNELSNYPLYREYNNTLSALNNTYAIVENGLNKYFQNKLN